MAAFSLISGAAQTVGGYGNSLRDKTEGSGSYDPTTGKFYNPKKVENMFRAGAMFSPTDVLRNEHLSTTDKLSYVFTGGASSAFLSKKYRKGLEAENIEKAEKYGAIRDSIEELPTYQVSDKASQQLELMQEASGEISQLGDEAVDLANSRLGEQKSAALDRNDIKQQSAANLEAIQMSGVPGGMGAIAQAGQMEQGQLRSLNKKQTAYRFQAENDLMNAKINQGALKSTGAQLEAQGMSGMINEEGKAYQSSLDKQLGLIQFDVAQLTGQTMQQTQSIQNMNAANDAMGQGIVNLAGSYLNNKAQSSK